MSVVMYYLSFSNAETVILRAFISAALLLVT